MTLHKSSTEKEPLLFFSTFLNTESLSRYEANFYDHPVNPSQIYNKDQGFIQYHKDCYEEGDKPTVKIYFEDHFITHLETQSSITEKFLIERRKAMEYKEIFANGFVKQQLVELDTLSKRARDLPHTVLVCKILEDLRVRMNNLLYPEKQIKPERVVKEWSKTTYPFFGNKQSTTVFRLKNLYTEMLEMRLLDEEEVREKVFINVFTSAKPFELEEQIKFSKGNYEAIYFLQELSAYFDKLKPAQIAKSKAFASKGGKTFTEETLNTYITRLKKKDINMYREIHQAIQKTMLPKK